MTIKFVLSGSFYNCVDSDGKRFYLQININHSPICFYYDLQVLNIPPVGYSVKKEMKEDPNYDYALIIDIESSNRLMFEDNRL